MGREQKSILLCISIFLSLSLSLSLSSPLQYQPQPLSCTSDHKSVEFETLPVSDSAFSLDLHHVGNLSPASNSSPESLFQLRLHRFAARVKSLSSAAAARGNVSAKVRDFSSSVVSGLAQGSGEYFTRLGVGTATKYIPSWYLGGKQDLWGTAAQDIWGTVCESLLHPHMWVCHISSQMLSLYFGAVTDANDQVSIDPFILMKPSSLFHIAASLCCQLKVPSSDEAAGIITTKNLAFLICGLHSILEKNEMLIISNFWSTLDHFKQTRFSKSFGVLDPKKWRRTLDSYISDDASFQQNKYQHPFISYLLQRLGKITFQREVPQMKIVFSCYKLIAPKLLGCYSRAGDDGPHSYAYQDYLKQFAQEVSESIRDIIYSEIRKNLKEKRDKRKQEEKIMAVVNPVRNSKRKLKVAAKHRAHKRRKIMTMKMGR